MVARTDGGKRRSNNEDAVGIHPDALPWPIAVLADGMGGFNAGEVASAMATSLLPAALQSYAIPTPQNDSEKERTQLRHALMESLTLTNSAILNAAQQTPGCQGMGTTVITAALLPGRLMLAHLGDSRAYGWRQGQLHRLTRDHTWLQAEIDAGRMQEQQGRQSGLGHLLTRALGVARSVAPDLNEWPLLPGDRILLCSDGLTDMLSDKIIASLFAQGLSLPLLLTALVNAANNAGGHDNIGVVLIEVPHTPALCNS
ncbi:PP2C family protein-serine/threonine phosphatase [Comamonas composti]|uniref:PP2C family protein-serine/threonine phosphatase n=1 Tax=Comamonas composti TaxID=408558 RepID=UPI000478ECC3|nr:protein phosphatase 2C domain-containing protein [Comamonas composti]